MTQLENFIPIADSVHVMVLRIIGSLALIFRVIELGLGGGLFNYLSNQKYGARPSYTWYSVVDETF